MIDFVPADWSAPPRVKALASTRRGGFSRAPFDSLNLGSHVGDDPHAVMRNRERLVADLALPGMPAWLEQVHGRDVVDAASPAGCRADAVYSDRPGVVCAVLTADCLPLLICSRRGDEVCAVHAGWRGLYGGVVQAAVRRFRCPPDELRVWLGPAIGPECFEVGADVRDLAARVDARLVSAFRPMHAKTGYWLLDIYESARILLACLGVNFVSGGDCCTVSAPDRFYSYRRDGRTGRMASLIWIDERRTE